MNSPKHLCTDPAGNVYIADDGNRAVRKYDPQTRTLSTVVGGGRGDPPVQLNRPHGVCFEDGTLYVVDSGNDRILRVETTTALRR
jgi:streptogramin lyase